MPFPCPKEQRFLIQNPEHVNTVVKMLNGEIPIQENTTIQL